MDWSELFVGVEGFKLFGKPDYSACYSGSWVSCFQGLLVTLLTQVVFFCVDDNWAPDNWVLSEQAYLVVFKAHVRVSERIWNQIAQVSDVSLFLERSSVGFAKRIVVGSSCGAAVSQISEFVDVDSVFTVGIEPFDWACDFDGSCGVVLAEGNDSPDFGVVGVQNADGISGWFGSFGLIHKVRDWGCGADKGQTEFSQHLNSFINNESTNDYYNW